MAIINVSPDTDITALIASASVAEGDVLLLAEGTYFQSVVISKNFIRIVSEDCGEAVFNGFNILATAFTLNNVTGVEIHGVTVKNYLANGIAISSGSANRIIRNKIFNIGNRGVSVTGSTANLIWKNQIENVFDGVELINSSTSNWVIENWVKGTTDDGFESFLSNDASNAFIGNNASDCGGNCFEIFGTNCLAYQNTAKNASIDGYLIFSGSNILAIENKEEKSRNGALVSSLNAFIAANEFKNNTGSGLIINSDFTIVLKNFIAFNHNSGLVLGNSADRNFIYRNKVVCNTPLDIVAGGGIGNNFLENITGCKFDCGC